MNLVAVYGTLRRGQGNFQRFMQKAKFVDEAVTPARFSMLADEYSHFPYLVEEGNTPIKVELFEVDDETLARLDYLEGVPGHYKRSKVTLNGREAIIYVASDRTREHVVGRLPVFKSGDWADHPSYVKAA